MFSAKIEQQSKSILIVSLIFFTIYCVKRFPKLSYMFLKSLSPSLLANSHIFETRIQ